MYIYACCVVKIYKSKSNFFSSGSPFQSWIRRLHPLEKKKIHPWSGHIQCDIKHENIDIFEHIPYKQITNIIPPPPSPLSGLMAQLIFSLLEYKATSDGKNNHGGQTYVVYNIANRNKPNTMEDDERTQKLKAGKQKVSEL